QLGQGSAGRHDPPLALLLDPGFTAPHEGERRVREGLEIAAGTDRTVLGDRGDETPVPQVGQLPPDLRGDRGVPVAHAAEPQPYDESAHLWWQGPPLPEAKCEISPLPWSTAESSAAKTTSGPKPRVTPYTGRSDASVLARTSAPACIRVMS